MEKIFITGTGRCGTTFLIKLFTWLEYNTGFTKENYLNYIYTNCNSGMEKYYYENYYIIKNPSIIENIEKIINDSNTKIKYIIIPLRNYELSAKSRVNFGKECGGLWNANNEEEQINFFNKIVSNYVYYMTKFEINTIFLDFDKMIIDKNYLYNKLKIILDEKNINFDYFSKIYDEVSINSKPKMLK